MNSRGPLPQPDSVRGLRGTNGAAAEFAQEHVECPAWLPKKMRADFQAIIDKQHAAGVGTRSADADMYAQYVVLLHDFRSADDAEERQKARRVMAGLEDQLVIGERARQRVGIRGKKVQAKGRLTVMMEKKNGTTGE
jgi:hypothetical protein